MESELNRSFRTSIGEKNWQQLAAIEEYRNNAIKSAVKLISEKNDEAYFCKSCKAETAVKEYIQADKWSIRQFKTTCRACFGVETQGLFCQECQRELTLNLPYLDYSKSYCSDCLSKARVEFKSIEFPALGFEVKRWFTEHDEITFSEIMKLARNVCMLGSGLKRLPIQLLQIGAISPADPSWTSSKWALKWKEGDIWDEKFTWAWNIIEEE